MTSTDRRLLDDLAIGYGATTCTECGYVGQRRLASRFPHVCHNCLFPSLATGGRVSDLPEMCPVGAMFPGERRIY